MDVVTGCRRDSSRSWSATGTVEKRMRKLLEDALLAATLRSLSEADREEEEKPNHEINLRIFGGITANEE